MCIVWSSIFIAVLWAVFYLRLPLIAGTVAVAAVLLAASTWSEASGLVQTLYWAVFLLIAAPLNLPVLRRALVSDRVLIMFRKVMPSMSDTEREALEAGSVWWDGELFSGKPDWSKLLETPAPKLSPEERAFLDGPTETLCRMIDDWHITQEDRDLPPEVWSYIKDNGFFSMIIPKQYGGLAFSALAHSSVVLKISSRSITAAVTIMVPNSLGPAELLLRYGTDEQKNHY
ncbi:MAG TPA: acyl-CoA dehydrogenase, partial [Gammaproteobacteria bacterium]|nr:acyl-CoA dehydrogenase [Gammaproteobacteria bacterium]